MSIPMQWRGRAWGAGAIRWAARRLAVRDIVVTGKPGQFHVRTWSTVIRLPTERGAVFFKAVWRPLRFEAGLTAAIATWAPDDVGIPLAVDQRRGWMLLEDGGQRLREILAKDRDIGHWHRILPQYAELQLAVAPHARRALNLGTPDRRARALATKYARLLQQPSLLRAGLKEGVTQSQDGALKDLVPQVRKWTGELSIVPETIQHDDLHDGQVFVKDGRYRILDWGDSCVSHPFLSMSVVERSVAYTLKLKPGSREIARLRDIYLEPFTIYASAEKLRAIYPIAIRLAWISRALSWATLVPHLSPTEKRRERGDVPRSLGRFLDPRAG
jgi:hypothetical protein